MKQKFALTTFFLSFLLVGFCQTAPGAQLPKGCVQLTPDQMPWIDTSSILPPGAKYSILYGDIKKEAPFAIRVKLPPNVAIKTHYHLRDEVVTVLEGSVSIGFGDKTESSQTKTFTANSFYVNAADVKHYVVVGDKGVTIQINSIGPWTTRFN
jgi:quercetin dioxygenase-like cupin family protein